LIIEKLVDTSLITVRKRDDSAEYYRQYRALLRSNPKTSQHLRNRMLVQRYGITQEDYDKILESQGGKCAICKTDKPGGIANKFHVDHCHSKGHNRGLLCNHCNQGLGHFKDNADYLEAAIQYLKEKVNG
jgi:Recombination endonuclease VII